MRAVVALRSESVLPAGNIGLEPLTQPTAAPVGCTTPVAAVVVEAKLNATSSPVSCMVQRSL
jgi:hypothetical protein